MSRRHTLQRRPLPLLAAVFVLATTAAIAHVWTQICSIDYGYKISRASRQHAELLETNRRLRTELAMLKNPARLMQLARNELGLVPPEPAQVRRLRSPIPRKAVARADRATVMRARRPSRTVASGSSPSYAAAQAATLSRDPRPVAQWQP